ncbi:hypothetical protein PybrP1_008069 [[Pythium] brassicae (nom. inval.)]|nr:hypothetical protein PybrP1_008069 [[Pythium] brassicae (nom. inval.)]
MPRRRGRAAAALKDESGSGSEKLDARAELAAEEALRAEISQISLLAPWTGFVARDASLSDDLNELRAQDLVFDELAQIYRRLQRQQDARDAAGMMPRRAARTLLENQLVVEATRKVDVRRIAENVKVAMQTAALTAITPTMRARRESAYSSTPRHAGRHRKASVTTQQFIDKRAEEAAARLAAAAEQAAVAHAQLEFACRSGSDTDGDARVELPPTLLSVQLPVCAQTLTQALDDADAALTADADAPNDQVLRFRRRPASQSAVTVADAGQPVARREPPRERVRYIMSTRLGALPPTTRILDEYPIPKAVLEALEAHRHVHVDASSLPASFEATPAGGGGQWECYVRRTVPVERKPVSFVLASLRVAPARPVPPPSDLFQQQALASATNDDLLLSEVRQLFDHTHEAYREFRATLHRHLELPYLVDLSFRTSLNSTSYFVDDSDGVAADEPGVAIPARLLRSAASGSVSKWRVARSSVNRIAHRRGAIAVHVRAEASAKAQRTELLNRLCSFTPHEVQLMERWYTHDADADEQPFDPVPMRPALSARFDAVWHELHMPAKERLDLAAKYSAVEHAARLADAVALWETAAALVREREGLLELIRAALQATLQRNAAVLAEENAMLQDLAACTDALKEILLLAYLEVGDFVTLGGNFYLARMEHETTELRQLIVDSIENMRRRSATGDNLANSTSASTASSSSTPLSPPSAAAVSASHLQ